MNPTPDTVAEPLNARDDLLELTPDGLYCPEGGFHVDPWRPVDRAVVTHAHSDHAAPGSESYVCAAPGRGVLALRVGQTSTIAALPYSEPFTLGDVRVSLHPAGHILGSSQVRIERLASSRRGPVGRVCVVSGDYKTDPDRTCQPFEPVPCHTFISESTFGLPIYRWEDQHRVLAELNQWWIANARSQRTSLVLAYALGKAQRILAGLDASIGPIAVHGSVRAMCEAYRASGVVLPPTPTPSDPDAPDVRGAGIVVAPSSVLGTTWLRRLSGGPAKGGLATAMLSGWMRVRGARRRHALDRGFVLSDHADWPALLASISATGAERVGITHGHTAALARVLRERGTDAFVIPTRFTGESPEDAELPTDHANPSAEPGSGA